MKMTWTQLQVYMNTNTSLQSLSFITDVRVPLVIFFFLTVLFLCLPNSRAAEDLGGAALGVLWDHGSWGRVRGRGAAWPRPAAALRVVVGQHRARRLGAGDGPTEAELRAAPWPSP